MLDLASSPQKMCWNSKLTASCRPSCCAFCIHHVTIMNDKRTDVPYTFSFVFFFFKTDKTLVFLKIPCMTRGPHNVLLSRFDCWVEDAPFEQSLVLGNGSFVELSRNTLSRLAHTWNQPGALFRADWPLPKTQSSSVGSYTSFILK